MISFAQHHKHCWASSNKGCKHGSTTQSSAPAISGPTLSWWYQLRQSEVTIVAYLQYRHGTCHVTPFRSYTHRPRLLMIKNSIITFNSLSLHFNGHFSSGPGLAGIRMSPFWILLEIRVMEVLVTTGARRVKLQSNRHHQQTNTQFFTGWMPFLSPNQQCQSTEGKSSSTVEWIIKLD